jgi:hypothetical protein
MEDLVKLLHQPIFDTLVARFEKISCSLVIAVTKPFKVWRLDLPRLFHFRLLLHLHKASYLTYSRWCSNRQFKCRGQK